MKKNIFKKIIISVICALTLSASGVLFAACNNKPVIGIIQFGPHESLNNIYDGFKEGLKEGGIDLSAYKLDFQNSNFDPSVSGVQADKLVTLKAKLIFAIATPSAMAAAASAKGKIPVVYGAVSDPAAVGLADNPETPSNEKAFSNVTGTSDVLNFEKQLDMIKAFVPGVNKIGVLYTLTEANSVSQIAELTAVAAEKGITVTAAAINAVNELPAKLNQLLNSGIQAITNLTDNTVVGELTNILTESNKKNIPVFGSEVEQVVKGCVASESIDYVELGRQNGLMAAKILKGEKKADEISFITINDTFPCYNSEALAALSLTLPASYSDILNVKAD